MNPLRSHRDIRGKIWRAVLMSHKKKNEKKSRTLSIGIGVEAGSELVFRWDKEAQTLAYKVKKEGKTVKPVNHILSYSYDRPDRLDKSPKYILRSSSPS